MDIMAYLGNPAVRAWIGRFLVIFFLLGGAASLAAGLGLIFNSTATLRLFASLNRWVSTRRVSRQLDIPHDTRQAAWQYRRWLALLFVLGGLYAVYGLAAWFNPAGLIYGFNLSSLRPDTAAWLVESVRWVLIVGNLTGIVVGIMLWFAPGALIALEARSAHWYSDRRFSRGADTMNLTLDQWVAQFPRAAGVIIAVLALALMIPFALALPHLR
jgi:hypothetical protein